MPFTDPTPHACAVERLRALAYDAFELACLAAFLAGLGAVAHALTGGV